MTEDRPYTLIFDERRCIGCRTCVIACKVENRLEEGSWMRVIAFGSSTGPGPAGAYPGLSLSWRPDTCRHCPEPPCREACPAGAIRKRPDGIVLIERAECTGCGLCADACPFAAIRFDARGRAQKCTLCSHRIDEGLVPFCVKECICGALSLEQAGKTAAPPREKA